MQQIIRLLGQGADIDAAAALDIWPWVRDYMSTPPPSVRGRVGAGDLNEAECTLGPGQYE